MKSFLRILKKEKKSVKKDMKKSAKDCIVLLCS